MKKKIFTLGIGLMTALAFVSCDRGVGEKEFVAVGENINLVGGGTFKSKDLLGKWMMEEDIWRFSEENSFSETYRDFIGCEENNFFEFKENNVSGMVYMTHTTDSSCNTASDHFAYEVQEGILKFYDSARYEVKFTKISDDKIELVFPQDLNRDKKLDERLVVLRKMK